MNKDKSIQQNIIIVCGMFVLSLVIMALLCNGGLPLGKSKTPSKPPSEYLTCNAVEYDSPYKIIFIDGKADVYGGVSTPSTRIKGTITSGTGGIEAKCGSYYRLIGVNWWGWVKISDTYE